jgi:phosphoglycolate phosphatase
MWIVWDWNGTLLDDVDACVESLNDLLSRRSLPVLDRGFFRRRFAFPARRFYEEIGMDVPDSEWDALAKEYHDAYRSKPLNVNPLAREALEKARAAGARQAILSALRSDFLADDLDRFGLAGYFDAVAGSDNLDGGSKTDAAVRLARRLAGDAMAVIGDSLHDREAADAMGAKFVGFGGGSHSPERLRHAGPVADTLPEAVSIALRMA